MTLYQKYKKLDIDFAAIGMEPSSAGEPYFCTPKGARVIGWAGVDGIHYCFVRGFGEMVFAVSPANLPGENVHPIAKSFGDLLGLLLACGSMDALEQAHLWDREQLDEYVAANRPSPQGEAVFDVLREKLGAAPMEEPYAYLRELQDTFDYGRLRFQREYYEALSAAGEEERPWEWKVTMEGGYRPRRGKPGREIPIGKRFAWREENWYVPAVYLCSTGLVADFCVEVDRERVRAFYERNAGCFTQDIPEEERERLREENPLNVQYQPHMEVNGVPLRNRSGGYKLWVPAGLGEGLSGLEEGRTAKWIVDHYGLDPSQIWSLSRETFVWEGEGPSAVDSLALRLERKPARLPGPRFRVRAAGDRVSFTHPVTGVEHTLTVRELEARELDPSLLGDDTMDYPTHYTAMAYTIFPELDEGGFSVNCGRGDPPRPKEPGAGGGLAAGGAVAFVRRSKDAPELFHPDGSPARVWVIASSLRFAPVEEVEWRLVFRKKLLEDMTVQLI